MDETSVTSRGGGTRGGRAAGPTAGAGVDGRASRGHRTRLAVVDALLALNAGGHLRPTAREIADEAGVSLRSVYVHFDDIEALFVAAARRHSERLAALVPPVRYAGTLEDRLSAFLRRRCTLNEEGAAVRRAALLQEPFSPVLQRALTAGRERLRADVAAAFAAELDRVAPPQGPRLLTALETTASPATWEALRTHQHLSVAEAGAQVRDALVALLRGWPGAPAGEPTSEHSPPDQPGSDGERAL